MSDQSSIGKTLKLFAADSIIVSVLMVIIGIVFIAMPIASGVTLCLIVGWILIAMGVVSILGFIIYGRVFAGVSLVFGIILLLCGAFCLTNPGVVLSMVTVIFGALVVIDAASSLSDGIMCQRAGVPGGIPLIIISVLLMILGIGVIFGPFDTVVVFLGWLLLADGIIDLVLIVAFGRRVKKAKKILNSSDDVIDLGER